MDKDEQLKRKNAFDGQLRYGADFERMTGRVEHLARIEKEKSKYLDDSGNLKPELVTGRPCPVCGTFPCSLVFIKEGFPHVKCQNCGMTYVNKVLKENIYAAPSSYSEVLRNPVQQEMDELKHQYLLDRIEEFYEGKGRLLDVDRKSVV